MNTNNLKEGLSIFQKGKELVKEINNFTNNIVEKIEPEKKSEKPINKSTITVNGKNVTNLNDVIEINGIRIEFEKFSEGINVNVTANDIDILKSVNGNINVNASGKVKKIETVNGNIKIPNGSIETVKTVNGNIKI